MTLRRLALLQWLGLLLGALVFAAMHVVGYGITQARCGAGGAQFGIHHDVWQASLMAACAVLVLGSEASAIAVFRGTRETTYEAGPPSGRLRFFAIAAIAANAIFLIIVLLDGFASIFNVTCRQA